MQPIQFGPTLERSSFMTYYSKMCCKIMFPVNFNTVLYSLLFLHFVGGSEIIKELAVHLHERLQHIVDKRDDRPK